MKVQLVSDIAIIGVVSEETVISEETFVSEEITRMKCSSVFGKKKNKKVLLASFEMDQLSGEVAVKMD